METFHFHHGNAGDDSASVLFQVSGDNSTTEGIYTILVQTVRNYDERPDRDVEDRRSSAFELPFPTVFFDDYALHYESPPFYITQGDKDYFIIDVPQKVNLSVGVYRLDDTEMKDSSIKLISRAIASKVPSGQYFSQIGVIPSGLEPFGLDADLGRLLLLEQTHGNLSQEGHIFRGMAGAYP